MMRDCPDGELRDLLPGYVHGTLPAAEVAAVAAHLETCADCAAEVGLIEAASRAFPIPAVDLARIVKALPAAPRGARHSLFATPAGRVAAAIGIVAIGAFSVIALRGLLVANPVEMGGRMKASRDTMRPAPAPTSVAAAPA